MIRFKEIYKFRRKIVTVNVLFAVISVVIVATSCCMQYSRHITKVIINSQSKIFKQTNERLNEYLNNTNRLSKTFFLNDEANSFIIHNMDFLKPEVFYNIKTLFSTYLQSEPSIVGLYIMSLDTELIAGDGYQSIAPDIIEELKDAAKESVGQGSIFLAQMTEEQDVLYSVRMIKSIEDLHDIAIGIIMLDKQVLKNVLHNMEITEHTVSFILDKDGGLVEGENLPTGIEEIDFDAFSENEYEIQRVGKKEYLVSCDSVEAVGWRVYTLIPMEDINLQMNVFLGMLLIILVLVIIAAAIFISLTNYTLTHPLETLINAFEKVSKGNLKYRAKLTGDDEIRGITLRFNQMMDDVENLTRTIYTTQRDLYEAELEKNKTELRLLQAQIKSHFLYNALGSLRGLGRAKQWEMMDECISGIVDMLRYVSSPGERVRLRDELEYIQNYHRIQNIRYSGKCVIHYEIDPDTLELWTPKLMLQPVVENAIEHGFKKGKRLVVKIQSRLENGICMLRILDNGLGMDAAQQEELNRKLHTVQETLYEPEIGHGMGLWNVQKRIKYLFGDAYGISVKSYEGKGTIVGIRIPSQKTGTFDG